MKYSKALLTKFTLILTAPILVFGSIGGFGSHVFQMLSERGVFDKGLKIRSMILPDQFIEQDTPEKMYKVAGLDAQSIEQKVIDALKSNIVIPKIKNLVN